MRGYDTQHEAILAIEQGIASGQFKNCTRLKYTLHGGPFEAIEYYYPVCEMDSITATNLFGGQPGCPKDCRLFVDRHIANVVDGQVRKLEKRVEARKRFWRTLRTVLGAPFTFFQKLPAIVQSLLIILGIMMAFPQFKGAILEILQALKK